MTVLLTVLGVGLNAVVLRDMFLTLFAPTRVGSLSSAMARWAWRLFHSAGRRRPDSLSLAGPVALVLIILLWTVLLVLGWALLLWPQMPDAFLFSAGMSPDRNGGFLDAVYLSLVTLGTLGYGDITPHETWLRVVAPLEALIGFALFTAAISWIMSIYPALARRRQLAREISLLERTEHTTGIAISRLTIDAQCAMLQRLAGQLHAVRHDFVQYPITYYFRTTDRESALGEVLPFLESLASQARQHGDLTVRFSGALLSGAIDELVDHLGQTWLGFAPGSPNDEVIAAYARDHLQERR